MTDTMYPAPALHGLIEVMERKMKQRGIPIGKAILKDGKIQPLDTAPKHVKQARKHKTSRKVKAWEKAQQK